MKIGATKRFFLRPDDDAPDWFAKRFLPKFNEAIAHLIQTLQGNVSLWDNTNCWFRDFDLTDNVESSELELPGPIVGMTAISAFVVSSGKPTTTPMGTTLTWRQTGTNKVRIKAVYTTASTLARVRVLFFGA